MLKMVGTGVKLRYPLKIYSHNELSIGNNVDIGEFCLIRATGGVTIGNNVLIASHCRINSATHPKELPRYGITFSKPVFIDDDVWLGSGVFVMPGVTIGKGSIIGSNAVVTKDVPAFTIFAGVPAKQIGTVTQS